MLISAGFYTQSENGLFAERKRIKAVGSEMFMFKLLQGFWKQWKEQSSSHEVPWVVSSCISASLSTWGTAPDRGSSPSSPGWTVLHCDLSCCPRSLALRKHPLPNGHLSSVCCRASNTVYLPLETQEQLSAEKRSHHLGFLFLKDTMWIQSSGEPPQPLFTDFSAAASPLPHLLLSMLLTIQELSHRAR